MFLWIILVVFAMVVSTLRQMGLEVDQATVLLVAGALIALTVTGTCTWIKENV